MPLAAERYRCRKCGMSFPVWDCELEGRAWERTRCAEQCGLSFFHRQLGGGAPAEVAVLRDDLCAV